VIASRELYAGSEKFMLAQSAADLGEDDRRYRFILKQLL